MTLSNQTFLLIIGALAIWRIGRQLFFQRHLFVEMKRSQRQLEQSQTAQGTIKPTTGVNELRLGIIGGGGALYFLYGAATVDSTLALGSAVFALIAAYLLGIAYWSSPALRNSSLTLDAVRLRTDGIFRGQLSLPAQCAASRVEVELQYLNNYTEREKFWITAIRAKTGRRITVSEWLLSLVPSPPIKVELIAPAADNDRVVIPLSIDLPKDIRIHAKDGFRDLGFWSTLRVAVHAPDGIQRSHFSFFTPPTLGAGSS